MYQIMDQLIIMVKLIMKFSNKFCIHVNFVQEHFYPKDFRNIKRFVNLIIIQSLDLNNYLS